MHCLCYTDVIEGNVSGLAPGEVRVDPFAPQQVVDQESGPVIAPISFTNRSNSSSKSVPSLMDDIAPSVWKITEAASTNDVKKQEKMQSIARYWSPFSFLCGDDVVRTVSLWLKLKVNF